MDPLAQLNTSLTGRYTVEREIGTGTRGLGGAAGAREAPRGPVANRGAVCGRAARKGSGDAVARCRAGPRIPRRACMARLACGSSESSRPRACRGNAAGAALGAWLWIATHREVGGITVRFPLNLEEPNERLLGGFGSPLALSPDGKMLAFRGTKNGGIPRLFVRNQGTKASSTMIPRTRADAVLEEGVEKAR